MIKAFEVTVLSDDNWHVFPAIEFQGKLWFSPKFRVSPDKQMYKLDLLVRFDNLRNEPAPRSGGTMHLVTDPIPKSVLDGQTTDGHEILVVPDLVVEAPNPSQPIH